MKEKKAKYRSEVRLFSLFLTAVDCSWLVGEHAWPYYFITNSRHFFLASANFIEQVQQMLFRINAPATNRKNAIQGRCLKFFKHFCT